MVREIVVWPDPRLKRRSDEVEAIDGEVEKLIADLFETMYATENGVGLAAPQIGVNRRVAVIDVSRGRDLNQALVLVNPVIEKTEGEVRDDEGCLSVPGESEEVSRAERVWLRALGANGQPYTLEADDLLAIAVQHEIDHLDGVLYVDRLSPLKRDILKKRMKRLKAERDATRE